MEKLGVYLPENTLFILHGGLACLLLFSQKFLFFQRKTLFSIACSRFDPYFCQGAFLTHLNSLPNHNFLYEMMILFLLFSAKATPVSLATTYFTVLTLAFFFGRLSMFKFSSSNLHYSASSSLVSSAPKNRPIFSLGFSLCFAALSFSLSYFVFSPFLAHIAGSFLPLLFHCSLTAMGYRSFISSGKPLSIPTSRMGRSASAISSSLL